MKKSDILSVILLRHGETDFNVKEVCQGWLPAKLTKKGILQARIAAEALKGYDIGRIYCSNLLRTRQTAKEVQKTTKRPITYVSWLREKDHGVWNGKTHAEYLRYIEENKIERRTFVPKNGESMAMMEKRVWQGFQKFVADAKESNVLFITHGGPIRTIITLLKGKRDHATERHCAITVIELERKSGRALSINCLTATNEDE